jgi:hypothetical protein
MVKEICHDICEARCSVQLKKTPLTLDFLLLQTFCKKVEENYALSLP